MVVVSVLVEATFFLSDFVLGMVRWAPGSLGDPHPPTIRSVGTHQRETSSSFAFPSSPGKSPNDCRMQYCSC
jgi:hypothetical protein